MARKLKYDLYYESFYKEHHNTRFTAIHGKGMDRFVAFENFGTFYQQLNDLILYLQETNSGGNIGNVHDFVWKDGKIFQKAARKIINAERQLLRTKVIHSTGNLESSFRYRIAYSRGASKIIPAGVYIGNDRRGHHAHLVERGHRLVNGQRTKNNYPFREYGKMAAPSAMQEIVHDLWGKYATGLKRFPWQKQ